MPEREKGRRTHHGPSTQPVDEGIEGAIFDESDDTRSDPARDLRDLDAAARGEPRIASRTGEPNATERTEREASNEQTSRNDAGEEAPPGTRPS